MKGLLPSFLLGAMLLGILVGSLTFDSPKKHNTLLVVESTHTPEKLAQLEGEYTAYVVCANDASEICTYSELTEAEDALTPSQYIREDKWLSDSERVEGVRYYYYP